VLFADNDKDSDIEIGQPTDVKHVAHIGWNGHDPSENNPSWVILYFSQKKLTVN